MTTPRRVLITGCTGNVGTLVRSAWALKPLVGLELLYQVRSGVAGDLVWDSSKGSAPLQDWIAQTRPLDAMIVLSGVVPARGDDLSLNVSIAQSYLEAAQKAGVKRVLLASSSAVYGTWKDGAFREDDALHPISDYGRAKMEMEEICAPFRKAGLEVCCLRIGNVAGADALLLNAAKREVVLDQFPSGGYPVRSYIGPSCLADVLCSLVSYAGGLPDCLNVATPLPVSMMDLADAAGLKWRADVAPQDAQERITLECGALGKIHRFTAQDSSAVRMVQDWRKVRAQ